MALTFPFPFPNPVTAAVRNWVEFGISIWRVLQKFRTGTFSYSATIGGNTISTVTFTDTSVGGSDTGFANTVLGGFVVVAPPTGINSGIQLDYAYVPANGKLTMQLRNTTGGSLSVSGTWTYMEFTF